MRSKDIREELINKYRENKQICWWRLLKRMKDTKQVKNIREERINKYREFK